MNENMRLCLYIQGVHLWYHINACPKWDPNLCQQMTLIMKQTLYQPYWAPPHRKIYQILNLQRFWPFRWRVGRVQYYFQLYSISVKYQRQRLLDLSFLRKFSHTPKNFNFDNLDFSLFKTSLTQIVLLLRLYIFLQLCGHLRLIRKNKYFHLAPKKACLYVKFVCKEQNNGEK